MRTTVSVICLLAIVLSTSEVYGYIGIFKIPLGKCFLNDGTILNEGQTITRGSCELASCGFAGHVEFKTCGFKTVGEPCKLGEIMYPKADYPKCCINVVHCPDLDLEF